MSDYEYPEAEQMARYAGSLDCGKIDAEHSPVLHWPPTSTERICELERIVEEHERSITTLGDVTAANSKEISAALRCCQRQGDGFGALKQLYDLLEQRIKEQETRIAHLEHLIHKLLNPTGDLP